MFINEKGKQADNKNEVSMRNMKNNQKMYRCINNQRIYKLCGL